LSKLSLELYSCVCIYFISCGKMIQLVWALIYLSRRI